MAIWQLGPNGAETSLMRIINQITAQDSGEIIFDNKVQRNHIKDIGYLPEEGLYKKMNGGNAFIAQLKDMPYDEQKTINCGLII